MSGAGTELLRDNAEHAYLARMSTRDIGLMPDRKAAEVDQVHHCVKS